MGAIRSISLFIAKLLLGMFHSIFNSFQILQPTIIVFFESVLIHNFQGIVPMPYQVDILDISPGLRKACLDI